MRLGVLLQWIGALMVSAGVLLPWVTTPYGVWRSASGLDVAAGVPPWHQSELSLMFLYTVVVLPLAGASVQRPRLRWLLLASTLFPLWECGAFLLRKVPYGDTTPQSLLLWGFGEYAPGVGILVSIAGALCLAAGVLRVLDVWGTPPADDVLE